MGSSASKPARTLGNKVTQTVSRAAPSAPSTAQAAQNVAQEARSSATKMSAAGANAAAAANAFAGKSTHPDPQYAPSGMTRREQDTQRQQSQSSDHKSADIMRDSFDPQFLQNLSMLGQVKVPKNATNYSATDQMLQILEARERSNLEAFESTDNPESFSAAPTSKSDTDTAGREVRSVRMPAGLVSQLLDERKHCETKADLEKLALEYDLPLKTIESLGKYFNSPTMGEEVIEEDQATKSQSQGSDFKSPTRIRGVWVDPQIQDVKALS